jgi:hypothetical protein
MARRFVPGACGAGVDLPRRGEAIRCCRAGMELGVGMGVPRITRTNADGTGALSDLRG